MSTVVTLAEFKAYVGTEVSANDVWLQSVLDAAEAGAGTHCQRHFTLADAASARVFVPLGDVVRIHDCTSVTSVTENGTAVTATSYQLEPLNGMTMPTGVAVPYTEVVRLDGEWYADGRKATVSVTATWGWASFPSQVKEAVLMLARDVAKGKDSAYGVVGYTEYAAVRARENMQVAALLADFCRVESWGIA